MDAIITDVIATMSWIDFLLGLTLSHAAFPVKLDEPVSAQEDLHKRFDKYHNDFIDKLSYRQKIGAWAKMAKQLNLWIC